MDTVESTSCTLSLFVQSQKSSLNKKCLLYYFLCLLYYLNWKQIY